MDAKDYTYTSCTSTQDMLWSSLQIQMSSHLVIGTTKATQWSGILHFMDKANAIHHLIQSIDLRLHNPSVNNHQMIQGQYHEYANCDQ